MKNFLTLFIFLFCALSFSAQTPAPTAEKFVASPQASPSPSAKQNVEDPSSSRYVRKDVPAQIPRFDTPPVIDGQLNDAVWQNAAVFGDFLQVNPGDNIAPNNPTEVFIGYDSKNFYIAFVAKEEKGKVRATVAKRDNIFSDDYIGLYIDTFNDQRQAYTFFWNPLGIQADGTFTEGRGEDYSVDIVMESKGAVTEDGYIIEVAIPFKSLRYEAGKNKQWGIHIYRRVKHANNELDSWMRNNRSLNSSLAQAGRITGMEGIETTRQLEINPSFTVSESGRRTRFTFDGNPAGRYVNDGIKGEFGMTAKFSLTPTITLDFAYNPDFAQVEADAPVSTANVRFPIFFAEKRPFFLERIDIFRSGMDIVNTRAIVDPDIAAKLTGRRGKNTFGLIYATDNAPGNYSKDERESLRVCQATRITNPNTVCGIEPFVDKNATIGVLRWKRDIGTQHNLGFFATTYNFPERHNHTMGFDGRFKLSEKIVTEFQLMGTNSRRFFYDPNLDKNLYRNGNGFGYRAYLERSGRNLYMNYLAIGRTIDYRADVGFTNRVDTNYLGSFIRYETDRNAKKSIIYKRLFNESNVSYDWKGRSQRIQSNTQGMIALQRQTYIGGGFEYGYERVFEHEFGAIRKANRPGAFFGDDSERSAHRKEVYTFIETSPVKQLFALFVLSYNFGSLDYDFGAGPKFPRVSAPYLVWKQSCLVNPNCGPAPGLDPGAGDLLYIESSIRYQPTSELQIQLNYNRARLTRNDTERVAFDDNIVSIRSTYQFTRSLFARMRLDYSNISTRVRPQLIFGWTPSPGKAFYVGYNDDINYAGFNPFTRAFEPGFRSNGRTFFIKMSYQFTKSF